MTIRTIKVGVKVDLNTGVQLFGAEEVNALIEKGWRVTSLQPGGVIFKKVASGHEKVTATISGCDLRVILEAAGLENKPTS